MEQNAVTSPATTAAPVTDSAQASQAAVTPQGYTGTTAPDPSGAATTQAALAADPTKDSPAAAAPVDDKADQRVSEAQRAMHAATTRAATLEAELTAILNHPMLGPLVQKAKEATVQAAQVADEDPVVKAYKDYQSAPNDQEAFAKLVKFAEERAKSSVMTDLEAQQVRNEEARRAQQRDTLIVQTINKRVQETAPDVPIKLFWAYSDQAELETPRELNDPAKRLEWQMNRTIEIARGALNQAFLARQSAQQQNAAVQQTISGVMPSGGAVPQGGGGTTTAPKTFVDQIKDTQRAQWR